MSLAGQKPTFSERALYLFSPKRAQEKYNTRLRETGKETGGTKIASPRMSYGNHGASQSLNSMVGWIVNGGAAADDIDQYSATLRKRSRDLFAGGGQCLPVLAPQCLAGRVRRGQAFAAMHLKPVQSVFYYNPENLYWQ